MEFPSLGRHCQEPNCNRTDFLPLKCECGGLYCREHFTSHCLSTGCGRPSVPTPVSNPRLSDQVFRCSSPDCRVGALHEMPCPNCGKHFCIEHRFHPECPEVDEETLATRREQFAAPRRKFQESNVPLQQQITDNILKALQITQKAKTASKVQLMRIKQKAVGPKTVLVSDRAYFSIVKPRDRSAKAVTVVHDLETIPQSEMTFDSNGTMPVFVSKKWSLGRAIDSICETCSILNENNKSDASRVRLFRSDGYGLGRTDVEVGGLIERRLLADGESLIAEYVACDVRMDGVYTFLNLPVETLKCS